MTISALRTRLGDEHGQALVLAIAIIAIGMVLGLGAVAMALTAGHQTNSDTAHRAAQQAAAAGVAQQLYQQADTTGVGYNIVNGDLGNLLDCIEPTLNLNLQITGLGAQAATAGACPAPPCTAGQANCTQSGGNQWYALDNETYYDAEFCPDPEYQSAGGAPTPVCGAPAVTSSSGLAVEFPAIVSIGCQSVAATCGSGAANNQYAKALVLLEPTAPLQAVEGENNVSISLASSAQCSIELLGLCVSLVANLLNATVVSGNVVAGNALTLPATTVGVNADNNLLSTVLGGLTQLLDLGGLLPGGSATSTNLVTDLGAGLGSLNSTYEYGKCAGTRVSYASGSGYRCRGSSVSLFGTELPPTHKTCQAGDPSTDCIVQRPAFTAAANTTTTPLSTLAGMYSGALSGTAGPLGSPNFYAGGDLNLTSGTLDLSPGTYAFCNVSVTGSASLEGPSGPGAVQIYILNPNVRPCSANPNATEGATCTGADSQGNFNVPGGVNNNGPVTGLVNGLVNSTVDPSEFQVYVAGDSADTLTKDSNCQPRTSVTIGTGAQQGKTILGTNLTQALVVYAPRSDVTLNTNLIFEGSLVGWNVNVSALAIIEDLDLGNYPLSSVINSDQPAQTITCSAQTPSLSATSADLSGC